MLILPTFCPTGNRLTMEVVEHRPNHSYEAQCTALWLPSLRQDFG